MLIREIKQTTPERLTLIFDDGRQLRTTLGFVMSRSISSGMELDEAEYEALVNASSLSLAKSRALKLVGARAMSAKQLHDKLIEKGESPENAEKCVEWLTEYGYINDAEFAAMIVRHYAAKGYGKARVKQELCKHGIENGLWDKALEEMPAQDDKLLEFLRARLSDPTDRAEVKRVSDALYRRGYSWNEIRHALNSFIAETEDFYP